MTIINELTFHIESIETEVANLEKQASESKFPFIRKSINRRITSLVSELATLKSSLEEVSAIYTQEKEIDFTVTKGEDKMITLTAEGIEVVYREPKEGKIRRNGADIKGCGFYEDKYGYWVKSGRGSVKNRKELDQILVKADSFIVSEGYDFIDFNTLR